ncbi:T9SS type B sorting domain-containing protein [Confluentibacter flavum]|uniref:PKD domain-containing protein n=1 Tax=Confluentibacter flavum TaxID=1909700 RepID=A0A2N3HH43_9FLAO|nr:T9SS type B sorting domain-containing protein [Confluentibacter flavum]PKQ44281.1 hypothetical protein CSW08_14380 [Confluentibacter flavum]
MGTLRLAIFIAFNLFLALNSFAQKEANIWYFGNGAGLDFNSSSAVVLTDGQTQALGSACMSDSNGNLLFYSDGITVWNRNHTVMQNGMGLLAGLDLEYSGQFVIAIPKPNSLNIYYIFTSDHTFGLRYSEIDMSLDNGFGAITNIKNVYLSPANTTISAVHHANGQDIWVLTHGWANTEFYSILVTSSGVITTPVTSYGYPLTSYWYGVLKFSPNGQKLVTMGDETSVALFNFDNTTGLVSDPLKINLGVSFGLLGAEFSPSGNVLYISGSFYNSNFTYNLWQFDLTATNISSSKVIISSAIESQWVYQMQLAPDQKIYAAGSASTGYISTINFPEIIGTACNFETQGIYLNGGNAGDALPQFIQSYFYVNIETENVCYGEPTQFQFNSSKSYDSLLWDFGDGYTSTDEKPLHTYNNVGDYTVTLTGTSGLKTTTATKVLTIYEKPIAYPVADQILCAQKETEVFYDLSTHAPTVLNGQDPNIFKLTYYLKTEGEPDFELPFPPGDIPIAEIRTNNNVGIFNIKINIRNINHPECEDSVVFNIHLTAIPNPSQTIVDLNSCDNLSVGTDSDGFVLFNLTQKETEILNGELPNDFDIKYFKDADLSNEIILPSQYQNTASNETIYVEISNKIHPECKATTSFKIKVFALPTVLEQVDLKQCDDDVDGFSLFNLNEIIDEITPNAINEIVTFHETEADAISGTFPIANVTAYKNETVSFDTLWARIENSSGCFKTSQVDLTVTTTQIPGTFLREYYACDAMENGIAAFDFSIVNGEILDMFPSGQELVINYYRNEADALSETNPIADISNYSNIGYPYNQDIYVRVDSKIDNDCIGLGSHIKLHVEPLPEFNIETPQIVCSSDPLFTVILDPLEADPLETFTYSWMLNGIEIATSPTLTVSTPGTYSIALTKTNGTGCSNSKEVFVNASETADITLTDVVIVDLSENNSITIKNPSSLGNGDYWFALESTNGLISYPYQDEPIFENLKSGIYTLFVEDKKGCGLVTLPISVIGYPKFFTPNNDGVNDTWHIQGINAFIQSQTNIYIFDRYGKLLKQLNPNENGWDGTYNGYALTTDDYWFKLSLQDGRTVMGHFALKR